MPRLLPAVLMGGALLAAPAFSPLTAPAASGAEADAAYGLTFDAAGLLASPTGTLVMKQIRQHAPEMDQQLAGLNDSLGLDLTRDLGVVSLTSDRDDLSDMTLVADLGKSSGKLEGWMLTLPGYDSEDLDDQTLLHGFDIQLDGIPQDDGTLRSVQEDGAAPLHPTRTVRVFAAIPQTRDGGYCLVASTQRAQTLAMVSDAAADNGALALASNRLADGNLMSMSARRLPTRLVEETARQPGAGVWKTIQGMELNIASDERFRADLAVAASTPARARQLKQLVSGLSAAVQLMTLGEDDPAVIEAVGMLNELSLNDRTDGTPGMMIRFDVPQAKMDQWLNRMLNAIPR